MKDELIKQILALLTGGILGVVFKYWYDYKGMVHKELWLKRYDSYRSLLRISGFLPQYPHKAGLTYADLLKASASMRDWYFDDGGLLLSAKTRKKYFKVQKEIQNVTMHHRKDKSLDDDYEFIRELFSQLRKQMADDLMSRRRLSS